MEGEGTKGQTYSLKEKLDIALGPNMSRFASYMIDLHLGEGNDVQKEHSKSMVLEISVPHQDSTETKDI